MCISIGARDVYYVANIAGSTQLFDDGYGMQTAPAYGLDVFNHRYELSPEVADELTRRYQAKHSRLPLGNAVARVTKAFGAQPCAPCQRRQAMLNEMGDRIAGYWRGLKL